MITGPADREIGHACLLLNAMGGPRVLLWYYENGTSTTESYLWDPAGANPASIVTVSQSLNRNVFCAGHIFLADGKLLVCGGLNNALLPAGSTAGTCCFATTPHCQNWFTEIFDPQTLTWSTIGGPPMHESRFYPTAVRITSDAGALVLGGTLDELCDAPTGPKNLCASSTPTGVQPPFWHYDSKYIAGWEILRGVPGSEYWFETGSQLGPVWDQVNFPNNQYFANFPNYAINYFRYYPRAFLLANPTPGAPETVFVSGDTHATFLYGWPTFCSQSFANLDRRQAENTLGFAFKISLPTGALTAVGAPFLNPTGTIGTGTSFAPVSGFYSGAVMMHTRATPGGALTKNRVLVFGGSHGRNNQNPNPTPGTDGHAALRQVQEWDDVGGAWVEKTPLPLGAPKLFQNVVLLPDGKILVNGGQTNDTHNSEIVGIAQSPAFTYEIYDPGTGPASPGTLGSFAVPGGPTGNRFRGYHAVAILLPDGRVLSCGGEDYPGQFPSRDSFEIYSPPYVAVARPIITRYPTIVNYGPSGSYAVKFTYAGNVNHSTTKVALMRPGSVTHHFDAEQRYIELEVTGVTTTGSSTTATFKGPDDATLAPPGLYMLFAVVDGRPSVASIVRVQ